MSVHRSWTVHCDGCGESDGGDLGAVTGAERRRDCRFDGWHVNLPGGRDICPGCWDEGKR